MSRDQSHVDLKPRPKTDARASAVFFLPHIVQSDSELPQISLLPSLHLRTTIGTQTYGIFPPEIITNLVCANACTFLQSYWPLCSRSLLPDELQRIGCGVALSLKQQLKLSKDGVPDSLPGVIYKI